MKKILAFLLAIFLLLSTVSCAVSTETSSDTAGTDNSPAATEASTEFFPAVKKKDYEGATFRMIGFNMPGEWYFAENTGESVLNDAVYEMNKLVETHLGVKLEYEQVTNVVTGGEIFSTVQPHMMAGDDVYQLCILHPYYSYNSFITGNYAYNFYEFDELDLEQDYWNRDVMDSLAINDKAYIALGDLCEYGIYMLYCNKALLHDVNREVPYDKVKNGEWTLDEFIGMTTELYHDENGNGEKDNQDIYGFAGVWDANASAFMQASGIYVASRTDEGNFELSLYGDKLEDMYGKLYDWSKNESVYLVSFGQRENPSIALDFLEGRSYFTLDQLGTAFLEAEFDVGVLPLPKYDVAQENYAHVNWGNNLVVPNTIKNPDMVGDVLEMMSYYTSTVVEEAYYDTVLQYRVSNAPEDREMVQLIYNTVVYDPGIAFCDGNTALWNLVYLPCFGLLQKKESVSSYYKGNSRSAQRWLDGLFDVE